MNDKKLIDGLCTEADGCLHHGGDVAVDEVVAPVTGDAVEEAVTDVEAPADELAELPAVAEVVESEPVPIVELASDEANAETDAPVIGGSEVKQSLQGEEPALPEVEVVPWGEPGWHDECWPYGCAPYYDIVFPWMLEDPEDAPIVDHVPVGTETVVAEPVVVDELAVTGGGDVVGIVLLGAVALAAGIGLLWRGRVVRTRHRVGLS